MTARTRLTTATLAAALCVAPAAWAEEGPRPAEARFVTAEVGDTACYLEVIDPAGKPVSLLANFEICETRGLIGQKVALTYERGAVLAASCEGDPDCKDRDAVWLVTKMEPAKP